MKRGFIFNVGWKKLGCMGGGGGIAGGARLALAVRQFAWAEYIFKLAKNYE